MKKIFTIALVAVLILSLVGCGNDYNKHGNQTTKPSLEHEIGENAEQPVVEEHSFNTSIKFENGIAYFDMTPDEFVEKYNSSLMTDSEYISKNLSTPKYNISGTGVQGTTIYQYDISNNITSIYTFAHTNENDKILELTIGIEKTLGNFDPELGSRVLSEHLKEMTMILAGISEADYEILLNGLSNKIANKANRLYYYNENIMMDLYSNEHGAYFRVSCMSDEIYNTKHNY